MSLATTLSDAERADVEAKLLRSLQRKGAASHSYYGGQISLKIVGNFPSDGLYSYEVTFAGRRRMAVESFASIGEAQHAAVAAAMEGPKAEAEAETAPVAQVVREAAKSVVDPRDMRHWGVDEVADHFKARGLSAHDAWNRYIIDTGLQPQFDLKDLLRAYSPGGKGRYRR